MTTAAFDHRPLVQIHIADHAARAGTGAVDDEVLHHHIVRRQLIQLLELQPERLDDIWAVWNRRAPSEPVFDRAIARCVEIVEEILEFRDASAGDGEPVFEPAH